MTDKHVARFWARVEKGPSCWRWTRSLDRYGYGQHRMAEGIRRAHRISWVLANGPIPDGAQVLHRCNNRRCVNPAHLYLGTPRDNVHDSMRAGTLRSRNQDGAANPRARFTWEEIEIIRRLVPARMTRTAMARRLRVAVSTVANIVAGTTYPDWARY